MVVPPKPRPTERDLSDGLRPHERLVLDLYDRGLSVKEVATEAGVPLARARNIIGLYTDGTDYERLWRKSAELASVAYLKAIAATGRSFT